MKRVFVCDDVANVARYFFMPSVTYVHVLRMPSTNSKTEQRISELEH